MISNNPIAGAVIFILIILGANFIMYAIARGWARGGDASWIEGLKKGLSKPMESQRNKSMDDLRQEIEKLQKNSEKKE